MVTTMRLHRFIAQCGVTSRRKAESLISEGRVEVNGAVVTEMGVTVDPESDSVSVDGKPLELPRPQVFLFNKPKGVVTTMSDPHGRKAVSDFFPTSVTGLKPVGRLDMATEGLLILTNDGELASRLTHPSWGVEKEYVAQVRSLPDEHDLDRLRKGIWIEGGKTSPAQVEVVNYDEKKGLATVTIVLHEGRKHQVRLMLEAVGHPVVTLKRVRIANFLIKGLVSGQVRKLGQREVQSLRRAVGLD